MSFSEKAVALATEILETAKRNGPNVPQAQKAPKRSRECSFFSWTHEPELDIPKPKPQSPADVWAARYRVHDLCQRLTQELLGPEEYITHIAGAPMTPMIYLLSRNSDLLKFELGTGNEASALFFVTDLKFADIIGDEELGVDKLSEKAEVNPQYIGMPCHLDMFIMCRPRPQLRSCSV